MKDNRKDDQVIRDSIDECIRRGLLEEVGIDSDGEARYHMTDDGKRYVESMPFVHSVSDIVFNKDYEDDLLKKNAIEIARFHREYCDKKDCSVQLNFLGWLVQKAGIKLSNEEIKEFL